MLVFAQCFSRRDYIDSYILKKKHPQLLSQHFHIISHSSFHNNFHDMFHNIFHIMFNITVRNDFHDIFTKFILFRWRPLVAPGCFSRSLTGLVCS